MKKGRRTVTLNDILGIPGILKCNPELAKLVQGGPGGPGGTVTLEVRTETKIKGTPKKRTAPERAMELMLSRMKDAHEIEAFEFEAIKLSVGEPCCWYCPDFTVWLPDGKLRFIECKGSKIWEDAMIKFRSARKQYRSFEFEMWQTKSGEINRIL